MKKKIVVIGGGGTAICLRALKPYVGMINLSAVVAMADSGGANGDLSKKLGILPSADILRAVLAMSPYDYAVLHRIFRGNKFARGEFKGHYLGNLFLMLFAKYGNDYMAAIEALENAVEAVGHTYPSTLQQTNLCAELSDESVIVGEAEIDRPKYDRSKKIKRVWLEPEVNLYSGAKDAVGSADYIILSQGSLYTSLIPNLLTKGMWDALNNSKARLIRVIGSCYETDGETGPETLRESVEQLQNYLPRKIDALVYSTHEFPADEKIQLEEKRWNKMIMDAQDIEVEERLGFDFEKQGGGTDPEKLGSFLKEKIFDLPRIDKIN